MDIILALIFGTFAALPLVPGYDDAAGQKAAADRQHERVCFNTTGLPSRVGPVMDYETASRREGGFKIYHDCN